MNHKRTFCMHSMAAVLFLITVPSKAQKGCRAGQFACESTGGCIIASRRCDATLDCADGSDEKKCDNLPAVNYTRCWQCSNFDNTGKFYDLCPMYGAVDPARASHVDCHGDCFTRTDDNNANQVVRGCTETLYGLPDPLPFDGCYRWKSQIWCVCSHHGCNGRPLDCSPVSSGCQAGACTSSNRTCGGVSDLCGIDQFRCRTDRLCIPQKSVCNGIKDCADRSDEESCECKEGQFTCESGGKCIAASKLCDATLDCADGSDEKKCDNVTAVNYTMCFECMNYSPAGGYVDQCPKDVEVDPARAHLAECQGKCFTRTDDKNDKVVVRGCTATPYGLPETLPVDGCYTWKSQIWCVCSHNGCNGARLACSSNQTVTTCKDGQCSPSNRTCSALCGLDQFRCRTDRRCILSRNVCNRIKDCADGSDEEGCDCKVNQFACESSGKCIAASKLCDATLDCADGSDEKKCDKLPAVNYTRCWECQSYDAAGTYYDQCPLGEVDPARAYLSQCHGKCLTHTDDRNAKLISRGCTTSVYNLPNPLLPDGCYKWFSEIWCVCSQHGCNGARLGKLTSSLEFDALNKKGINSANQLDPNFAELSPLIALFIAVLI